MQCEARFSGVVLINRFRSRFPKIRLNFIACAHEENEKDLRKGITDLAFLLTESIQAAGLWVEAVGFESKVLAAHPEKPLAERQVVHTHDLKSETVLSSKVAFAKSELLYGYDKRGLE